MFSCTKWTFKYLNTLPRKNVALLYTSDLLWLAEPPFAGPCSAKHDHHA